MVSAQLHRLPLGSILFAGIAVARAKDRDRGIEADNGEAVQQCIAVLKTGGQLVVMPEGTSSLGPGHLPFHRGAARIVKAALDAGVAPVIVPLAVHYEDPTAWQSRVEVLVGDAVRPEPDAAVGAIHRLISGAWSRWAHISTVQRSNAWRRLWRMHVRSGLPRPMHMH